MELNIEDRHFTVIRLLGKGKGGYSYLVTDGQENYVLKQIHHEPCEYYSFGDKLQSELDDYVRLKNLGIRMPEMLMFDRKEERILKTYIDGPTVDQLVWRDALPNTAVDQVKEMCKTLYTAGLNIDYYPTNFVVQDGLLYYIDYECNPYMEQWDFEHWGCRYWEKTQEFIQSVKNTADQ